MHIHDFSTSCLVEVPCYDNDEANESTVTEQNNSKASSSDPSTKTQDSKSGEVFPDKMYTREELKQIVDDRLAKDRKTREESNLKLEKQLQELLKTKQLSEQERDQLQNSLEDVQKQLRTKESQLAHEKQQIQAEYEEQLKQSKVAATEWENLYRQSSIERALQDAAINNDAYNAKQIVNLLRHMTNLVEVKDESGSQTKRFETIVDFPDVNPETGESFMAKYTPAECVKRMKELEDYANLFKSNFTNGIGTSNTTSGLASGPGGKIDIRKLSIEQYMKLRNEQPELFGFKK